MTEKAYNNRLFLFRGAQVKYEQAAGTAALARFRRSLGANDHCQENMIARLTRAVLSF